MNESDTEPETESSQTRRNVLRTVSIAGATVIAPSFVNVASGATASGNVELTTTTTQPTDTGVAIRINEDLNGDGTIDNTQEETITAGTDVVTEYAALEGTEGDGVVYHMELTLTTSDDTQTPEVDTATITLPETSSTPEPTQEPVEGPDNPESAFELWNNYRAFVAFVSLAFGVIGLWGRSLALGGFLAYLAFAYIAVTTQTVLFTNILYVTIVLIFVGFAFKLWRLEFGGE